MASPSAPIRPRPLAALLDSFDQSRDQLLARLDGLTDAEYLWEPVAGCWTVRPVGGGHAADSADVDPYPPPVTTPAWRLWHIAIGCMDGYSTKAFGNSATGLMGRAFVGTAAEAVPLVGAAIETFRAGVAALGEDGVWEPLGGDWGPYREHSYFDLALHAHRELTHHGAEIGTLRDLYRWRSR